MPPITATAVGQSRYPRALPHTAVEANSEFVASDVGLASQPPVIAAIVVSWIGIGFLGAVIMSRRGHDFRPLAGLGVVFGPLFIGLVLANLRPREKGAHPVILKPATDLGGTQSVVVTVTGEPLAVAGALPMLARRAPDLGRVDLVRPVTYEVAGAPLGHKDLKDAERDLHAAALILEEYGPGLVLVPGREGQAISEYIDDCATDLVVVVGAPNLESELADASRRHGTRILTVPHAAPIV